MKKTRANRDILAQSFFGKIRVDSTVLFPHENEWVITQLTEQVSKLTQRERHGQDDRTAHSMGNIPVHSTGMPFDSTGKFAVEIKPLSQLET